MRSDLGGFREETGLRVDVQQKTLPYSRSNIREEIIQEVVIKKSL